MISEKQQTVLIVDDESSNLENLSKLLKGEALLKTVNNGQKALELAAGDLKPDLILLDVQMPGMDGFEVINRLKENPQTNDIPVIFITVHDSPREEEQGLLQGAVDYITKPFYPAVVRARVRSHLDLKRAEAERLHFRSNFDQSTGLPNQRYTLTLLETMLAGFRSNGTGGGGGILVLEFGNLPRIRNGYSREISESLLKEAATRLENALTANPHILGLSQTDQFLLGLECMDSPSQRLPALVQHLLEQMQQTFETDGRQFDLYPRLGVAVFPDEGEDPHTLLRSAEAALTQVAEQQDSAYSFSDPHNQARMREQLELESDLRSALDNGEFFLVYQPQYRLSTGKMIGAEALLRWRHPERGVISPAQFIPLLEETGLIEEVGEWLLGEALRQGRVWHQAGWGDLHMAVNLSPRQIKSRQLLKQITTALERTGFPEDQLELEITESLLLENDSATQRTMQILQGMGIEVALDDFGTGYSALTYLHTFPLQTLKIDRAFVWTIGQSRQGEALLRGIVELGKALSMNIVAEGIENADHQTFLQQHSDLRGQGFGLGKPMSGEAVLQQLQEAHNEQPDPATAAGGQASH